MITIDQIHQADVQLLPSSVQELVRVIGLTAALKLVELHGGTSILIPQGKKRAGQIAYEALAEIIGYKEMALLAEHYRGDDVLYIPSCKAAVRAVRNRLIRSDFDAYTGEESANRAVMKLARDHHLSDRRVWEILKEVDLVRVEQVSLF
ncbi:Mor transcription activator family protein [Chitinibacter sp. ZOR0017]|uniref:Mor transcription activator family protein n=1 Tax=Chitinibacter sp. ZOR0017 TaxID=1339254 RepID=UPI00068BDC48|nr:Mor transcription activator family protein [Chitinibacter sp. ZOR0017]